VPQTPHHRSTAKRIRDFAKKMRREPTDAEARMWKLLRDHRLANFKFHRQEPFQSFILDFVLRAAPGYRNRRQPACVIRRGCCERCYADGGRFSGRALLEQRRVAAACFSIGRHTRKAERAVRGSRFPSPLCGGKVAIGGLRPPFSSKTPMPCIGYAKSATDEGLSRQARSRREPLIRRFAPPCPTRGEGRISRPPHPRSQTGCLPAKTTTPRGPARLRWRGRWRCGSG